MLHLVLYILLAIVVAVGLFLLASRFLPAGEQIAPVIRDEPVWELPDERGLRAEDVDGVRLPVALRGYRFAETDVLLDRLAEELRTRDAEIARLRGERRPAPDRTTFDDPRATDRAETEHTGTEHPAAESAGPGQRSTTGPIPPAGPTTTDPADPAAPRHADVEPPATDHDGA